MKAVLKACFGQREVVMGEKRAEQHLVPFWAVLLKTAHVQCSHHLLTDHASRELRTIAVGLLTGLLLVIEFSPVREVQCIFFSSAAPSHKSNHLKNGITSKLTSPSPPISFQSLH